MINSMEELLECSASQLEAMTDEQLVEFCKPFLTITRPKSDKVKATTTALRKSLNRTAKIENFKEMSNADLAKKLAEQFGLTNLLKPQ